MFYSAYGVTTMLNFDATLRLKNNSKTVFLILNRRRRMRCFKRFAYLCKPRRELNMQSEVHKYRRQLQV